MKKLFYFFVLIIVISFISIINIFFKKYSDTTHLISFNIIFSLNTIISIICLKIINQIYKKTSLESPKDFRTTIKNAFANSFFKSTIVAIVFSFLVYGFLGNFLKFFQINQGLINYSVFISKIWFISSPFLALELAVLKYFTTLEFYKKPIIILLIKFILFFFISLLNYNSRRINCFIYAKPICDFIFLIYYSIICFDITLIQKK